MVTPLEAAKCCAISLRLDGFTTFFAKLPEQFQLLIFPQRTFFLSDDFLLQALTFEPLKRYPYHRIWIAIYRMLNC